MSCRLPQLGVTLRSVAVVLAAFGLGLHTDAAAALDLSIKTSVSSALVEGQADTAIQRLNQILAENPQDADAHNLLCRVYYQEQRWDEATRECEEATRLSPASSNTHLWLGRVYGEKADRASYFQAYRLSQRIRTELELAVRLDPKNPDALADLAQFYTEAPSIVGGGIDKAKAIVARMEAVDPAQAHDLLARIASQQKDYARAENEWKAAISMSPTPARYWTALASFYRKQQRWDDMMHAIREGVATDRTAGVAHYYAASLLIRSDREPELAVRLLEQYLASENKSEEAPAFHVHAQLAQLLQAQGDVAGAQREVKAAKALASDYRLPNPR